MAQRRPNLSGKFGKNFKTSVGKAEQARRLPPSNRPRPVKRSKRHK